MLFYNRMSLAVACVLLLHFVTGVGNHAAYGQVQFLEQNWNEATRQFFYTESQGSRLLPYEWFLALEKSDSEESFARNRLLELGFLANPSNADGLPVGFTMDKDWAGQRHLGLNCAACHTSQIKFADKTFQIDGGPTLADMWGLLAGIGDSLNATVKQPDKWSRFSKQILGSSSSTASVARLKGEVDIFLKYYNSFVESSKTLHPWGRGRLDAFGMIFNRVTSIDLGIPENSAPPDAPVSFPFLWGTSWENKVQWNGSAENTNDIERLGRNIGEVLGVFAQADLDKASIFKPFYRTSARRLSQLRLENRLKDLWSPAWPTQISSIDPQKSERGRILFNQNCVSCHEVIPHGQQRRQVTVKMTPLSEVGTDPKMATNAAERRAKTGRLEGSRLPGLDPLPAETATGALLQNVVRGAILSPFRDVDQSSLKLTSLESISDVISQLNEQRVGEDDLAAFLKELNLTQEEVLAQVQLYEVKLKQYVNDLRETSSDATEAPMAVRERILAYKGRPLDGIWATAPYLHNGSVPNLYELVSPVAERSKTFHVGSIEFDDKKVGFKTDATNGASLFDTSLPGNSNKGHDTYGVFTEDQRWDLVEYMKSL